MNRTPDRPGDELDRALDSRLSQTLKAPAPSPSFRKHLRALIRAEEADLTDIRDAMEHELREKLAGLQVEHLRLAGRSVAVSIGLFAAAVALWILVHPWLHFQSRELHQVLLSSIWTAVGIAIGIANWNAHHVTGGE